MEVISHQRGFCLFLVYLLLVHLLLLLLGECLRVKLEEVNLQELTDVEQHTGINGRSTIYLVDVCTMASQLVREPYRCLTLALQLLLDEFANNNSCIDLIFHNLNNVIDVILNIIINWLQKYHLWFKLANIHVANMVT